jgi:hypothetical protein
MIDFLGFVMRRIRAVAMSFLLFAGARPTWAAGPETDETRLVIQARKSVAWLEPIFGGKPYHATGFVISRPGDGKKVIITSGHIFHEGMSLRARLPGMSTWVVCKFIDQSYKHDLMVVTPITTLEAPPLRLATGEDVPPRLNDPVLVIGCPGGLGVAHYKGYINSEPISAAEVQAQYQLRSPFGDTILLRHSTYSTGGMSGGPILNGGGRVIGVQMGTPANAANVSLGIHAKHIAALDLDKEPRAFLGGQTVESDIHHVLAVAPRAERPILVRMGDELVDARCSHLGYVPKDADTVIERYIQDGERFIQLFTKKRLQSLLDETPIAHITNSAFGFHMLVPKGYQLRTERTQRQEGIIVTLTSGDPTIAPPYNSITVRAFLNTDLRLMARRHLDEGLRTGRLSYPEDAVDNPYGRDRYRAGFIAGLTNGLVRTTFPTKILGIRVRDADGEVTGPPDGEVFRERTAISLMPDRKSYWHRMNYDAEDSTTAHAVHCAISEDVSVVVHYQFQRKDRDSFFEGKPVSSNFLERAFIASTVSVY